MANRFSLAVASVAAALLLACGDGGEEPGSSAGGPDATASTAVPASPNATGAAGATGSSVDATRFVFGASPGKPVVYWIHTEW